MVLLFSLAEYSDENMMDPYNLAICFGPTLMPAPPDLDQVEFQSNVNDVIKLCINFHRRIFDPTVPGAYYEKFAAYASAVPPVLPRALASEAVKKACSLRHQATAPPTVSTPLEGRSGSSRSGSGTTTAAAHSTNRKQEYVLPLSRATFKVQRNFDGSSSQSLVLSD